MTKERIGGGPEGETLKKSPTLVLNKTVGSKVVGIIERRIESTLFPGKYSTLMSVLETNAPTVLWNKETQKEDEVDIEEGDKVFIRENTVLANAFSKLKQGDKVEIVYLGKGKAKKGQKPPYLFDIFKLGEGE
jgi:hypothetical protein